jgi:hypothetical protein
MHAGPHDRRRTPNGYVVIFNVPFILKMSYNRLYQQDDGRNKPYNQFYRQDDIQTMLFPALAPRPFGDSLVVFSSVNQPTLDSIGSGWTQIRYLPGTSTRWFAGNNNLLGYIGTEFLFTTGNFSRWLICDRFQVNGELYDNTPRTIKRSSISAVPYTAKWYFRDTGDVNREDPWISLEDMSVSITSNTVMYGENGIVAFLDSIHPTGMYVFTR